MNADELTRFRAAVKAVSEAGQSECTVCVSGLLDLLKHAIPDECRQNRHCGERKISADGDTYSCACVWCGAWMGGGFVSHEVAKKHWEQERLKREAHADREDACPDCEGTGECRSCDGGGDCENCGGEG